MSSVLSFPAEMITFVKAVMLITQKGPEHLFAAPNPSLSLQRPLLRTWARLLGLLQHCATYGSWYKTDLWTHLLLSGNPVRFILVGNWSTECLSCSSVRPHWSHSQNWISLVQMWNFYIFLHCAVAIPTKSRASCTIKNVYLFHFCNIWRAENYWQSLFTWWAIHQHIS